jgi:23S rRNA-/tRNA-specific pseudouridylate synthase
MKTTQIRLHKFLINWLQENDRSNYTVPEIKRNIVEYGVFVSGVLTHSQLEWVYPSQTIALNNWPSREPGDVSKIKVVYEDFDCMVLNKPAGLVVEPGAGHPSDNIVSWLLANYPEQNFRKLYGDNEVVEDIGDKYYDDSDEESRFNQRAWAKMTGKRPKKDASNAHLVVGKMKREHQYNIYLRQEKIQSRPYTFGALVGPEITTQKDYKKLIPVSGLVHRLDKDTQGLLLVAKNLESFHKLQDQFRSRNVVKKYLAVVDGIVENTIHLENWQARSLSNPIEQKFFWTETDAFGYSKDARHAESIIQPLYVCNESNQSIIQIQIKTGRMHQIRIQCLALGFPLTNDKAYNSLRNFVENSNIKKAEVGNSPLEMTGTAGLGPATHSPKGWQAKPDGVLKSDGTDNGDTVVSATKLKPLILPREFQNNPNNSTTELTKQITELKSKEFETKQRNLFGEGEYCLLSNHLEIVLPSGKLTKFMINEI